MVQTSINNQFMPHPDLEPPNDPHPYGVWGVFYASCFRDDEACDYSRCSQFFSDEYSITHFSYGYVIWYWAICVGRSLWHCKEYGALGGCGGWWKKCMEIQGSKEFDFVGMYITLFLAGAWEFFENTDYIIEGFRANNINNIDYGGDSALNVIGDNIIVTLGFVCMDWTRLFVSHRLNLCGWETHPERGFLIIFTITWIYIIAMTWYLYALICDSVLIMAANLIQPVRSLFPPSIAGGSKTDPAASLLAGHNRVRGARGGVGALQFVRRRLAVRPACL